MYKKTAYNKIKKFFPLFFRFFFKFIEGPGFKRKIGFECDPIRFKATGKLESPNLVVEFDNEDLMFRTAIGDLIRIDDVSFMLL